MNNFNSNHDDSPDFNHDYDVAVIGNGLIGSATSRYLSAANLRVAAIGPGEPENWKTHHGVFASHYDQGRITRIIDPDPVWATLGARSIAAYADLQEQSKLRFHHPVGCLRVSPYYQQDGDTLAQAAEHGRANDTSFSVNKRPQLTEMFPFFNLAENSVGLWEENGAGYTNPRSLAAAQLTVATQQGAQIIRETVQSVQKSDNHVEIITNTGATYRADRVVIAAGAYTNHLLPRPLELHPRAVSILLAELDEAEAARLHQMPAIIYRLAANPTLFSIYALPPIPYPDGKTYIKIGGTLWNQNYIYQHDQIAEWFHTDGNPVETDAIRAVLLQLIPDLKVKRFHTRPCVVTYTQHEHPYIDVLDADSPADGRIFVAAGGCGAAAKSSNELGRIAAMLVQQSAWKYDIPQEIFRAQYAVQSTKGETPFTK